MARAKQEHQASARERILSTASDLFYRKGINNVGINEVIAASDIARMTLYNHFKSKEELVLAVLSGKLHDRQERIESSIARARTPQGKIHAIFGVLDELVSAEHYRGCVFINAAIEQASSDGPVHSAAAGYKRWIYDLFEEIAKSAGWRNPIMLAQQLLLLWDGAAIGAYLHHSPNPAKAVIQAADVLIEKASQ